MSEPIKRLLSGGFVSTRFQEPTQEGERFIARRIGHGAMLRQALVRVS
jgi:hypothetical protein